MGIVLDSSLIIAAERRGHTVREILEQVMASQGETEIGLSNDQGAETHEYCPNPSHGGVHAGMGLVNSAVMTSEHKPRSGKTLHVTRVFVKREGRWQITLGQQTALGDAS